MFRLRNGFDLQAFLDEVGALADKSVILQMYKMATEEPYSFLYVRLNAKDRQAMFFIRYEKRLEF